MFAVVGRRRQPDLVSPDDRGRPAAVVNWLFLGDIFGLPPGNGKVGCVGVIVIGRAMKVGPVVAGSGHGRHQKQDAET